MPPRPLPAHARAPAPGAPSVPGGAPSEERVAEGFAVAVYAGIHAPRSLSRAEASGGPPDTWSRRGLFGLL